MGTLQISHKNRGWRHAFSLFSGSVLITRSDCLPGHRKLTFNHHLVPKAGLRLFSRGTSLLEAKCKNPRDKRAQDDPNITIVCTLIWWPTARWAGLGGQYFKMSLALQFTDSGGGQTNYLTLIKQFLAYFGPAVWQDNNFKPCEDGLASLRWLLKASQSSSWGFHTVGQEPQEKDDSFLRRHGLLWLYSHQRFHTAHPELRTSLAHAGRHLSVNQRYR